MKKLYRWLIGIGLAILLIIGIFVGYSVYFAKTINPTHAAPGIATACGTTVPSSGLQTFQIVPAQTTASYQVHEDLIIRNLPSATAIGTTHTVQGTFRLRTGSSPLVAAMNITVDLGTLQTNEPKRDQFVSQNALQTDIYPITTFVSTCSQGLPTTYSDGQMVHFQLIGNLTLHGTTNKEVFDVQGKLAGSTVTGTATSTIYMTDFGIQPPNLANIAVADNKVLITLTFTAKAG